MLQNAKKSPVPQTTMKNDIILFAAMFAIAWIGFNVINEQFSPESVAPEDGQVISTVNPVSTIAGNSTESSSAEVASVPDTEQSTDPNFSIGSPEHQIKSMLKNRVHAWNSGNFETYIAYYRNFDNLSVTIGDRKRKGWQPVFDFLKSEFNPKMGTMRIADLEIDTVSDESAIAAGKWTLQRENDVTSGRITSVLKRVEGTWKVTAEHLAESN